MGSANRYLLPRRRGNVHPKFSYLGIRNELESSISKAQFKLRVVTEQRLERGLVLNRSLSTKQIEVCDNLDIKIISLGNYITSGSKPVKPGGDLTIESGALGRNTWHWLSSFEGIKTILLEFFFFFFRHFFFFYSRMWSGPTEFWDCIGFQKKYIVKKGFWVNPTKYVVSEWLYHILTIMIGILFRQRYGPFLPGPPALYLLFVVAAQAPGNNGRSYKWIFVRILAYNSSIRGWVCFSS